MINDLADLNSQIGNSIVIRDIAAVDDTAHAVSLTTDEVDRLGEGSVQIEATQTDAVGNEQAVSSHQQLRYRHGCTRCTSNRCC